MHTPKIRLFLVQANTENALLKSVFASNAGLYAKHYFYCELGLQKRKMSVKNRGKKSRVRVSLIRLSEGVDCRLFNLTTLQPVLPVAPSPPPVSRDETAHCLAG